MLPGVHTSSPATLARGAALAAAITALSGLGIEGRQTYRLGLPTADVVLVDFLATDRAGQPVLDLTPAEVVLKIDGRARPVVSLQMIDVSGASGAGPAAPDDRIPPPFGSNVASPARSVVVLIDDDSIRPGRERDTLAAAGELLDRLPPHARVVIATPHGGWKNRLTTDRADARRVLAEISGRAFNGDDVECRTRVTLDAVGATLAAFGGDDAPTILVISGGLAGPRQEATSGNRQLAGATAGVPARTCDLRLEDFLKLRDAAAATRAHLYVIQPDDVLVSSNMEQSSAAPIDLQDGLNTLAGVTGGKLIHLTPASGNPLIGAERESSAYYLAGFERTAAEAAGASHRLEVQVTRPQVTVVRRTPIKFDRPVTRTNGPEPTTPAGMVRDPAIRRALPLPSAGYASRNADPAAPVRILVFAETLRPGADLKSAAAALFDPQGRVVSEWTSSAAALGSGPILAALTGRPGTYRLRVAALDSEGRSGTADYFVDASLAQAGPLKMSALMLAVAQNGALRPALEFSTEQTALASLEVYGDRGGKNILATLEVAESLNGPSILTSPVGVTATREPDAFLLTASIPIGRLPPRDYVVRVTVNLQDHPQGRVVRTLRKR
jgi:VWFA-related protein